MRLLRSDQPPRIRNLMAFSVFIMALFALLVLYQAFSEYDRAIRKGRQDADRLATILSDQIGLSLLTVDLTLRHAVERQHLNMLFGGKLPDDLVNNFNVWVRETPQIVAMILVNEKGDVELAVHDRQYEGWLDYKKSMKMSAPFLAMRRHEDVFVDVSPYADPQKRHANLMLVSRRVSKMDGSFGGMVTAAVYGEYFLDFLKSVDAGDMRYLSLLLNDGVDLLAGANHPRNDASMLAPARARILAESGKRDAGGFIQKMDGSSEMVSFRRLATLPLTVAVMIDEDDFLGEFWRSRVKDISFLAIFAVFGSVLSFFAFAMARQIVRVEESEAAAILASQAKSEFLANMSHELRTPLNAIIGFSEMMNAGYFGPMNAKQKERMNDINLCGNHLLHLINDILEFSKGEAGKLELVEERCNVGLIVEEVYRMMGEKVKSKGVNLVLDMEPHLPMLFADKRKVRQILINLLSNAIKFTPKDGDIRVAARVDGAGALNLIVTDTGVGIAAEDIQTALSVFGQVHRNKSHEGTGLGLPLCRMFAELHGGKLTLVSTIGEGTTVRVVFPTQRVIREEKAA